MAAPRAGDHTFCIACREQFTPGATKCPHCHTSQESRWYNKFAPASTLRAILIGLTSLATFLVVGLPTLQKNIFNRGAVLSAELSGGGSSSDGEKYHDILIVNYGLATGIVFRQYACYWYSTGGQIVADANGNSFPEFFRTADPATDIPGESTRILRFNSLGGLPLDEDELANVDLSYQKCKLVYTDVSETPQPGQPPVKKTLEISL